MPGLFELASLATGFLPTGKCVMQQGVPMVTGFSVHTYAAWRLRLCGQRPGLRGSVGFARRLSVWRAPQCRMSWLASRRGNTDSQQADHDAANASPNHGRA